MWFISTLKMLKMSKNGFVPKKLWLPMGNHSLLRTILGEYPPLVLCEVAGQMAFLPTDRQPRSSRGQRFKSMVKETGATSLVSWKPGWYVFNYLPGKWGHYSLMKWLMTSVDIMEQSFGSYLRKWLSISWQTWLCIAPHQSSSSLWGEKWKDANAKLYMMLWAPVIRSMSLDALTGKK